MWPTVADYIGFTFVGEPAPLLMQNGDVMQCLTSLDEDYHFSQNVTSACWPSGFEEEPERNHVVRVTLELPLRCWDAEQGNTVLDEGMIEEIPVQTILVEGDVALCPPGEAGEDMRSYRQGGDP
mmetsp:Transcript_4314/g.11080  ORF Transcript_4314/g.11080 Transcript_4314/m.11080 type:complete len:124 (+) Transcript_4314:3-374(+)